MDELSQLLKKSESKLVYVDIDFKSELNNAPTIQQKNDFLFRIERSQISDELEKYIRMNIDSIKLSEFVRLYNKVIDQTPMTDPRAQWKQFNYKLSNPTFF